jgi:anti-sigma B factor antagonist
METLLEKVGAVQVVHLRGRLDLASSNEFGGMLQGLISAGEKNLVLECSDLKYVSSAGLGTFIAAGKSLSAAGGGKVVFAGLSQHLQSLFTMTGIANLFEMVASKDDALAKLNA